MERPDAPAAWQPMLLRVPMVAAGSRAMTLASRKLAPWQIERFIVSGASQRGWTTWLVAIADQRVDPIIPLAIDLLDTRTALVHRYRTYGGNWPIAFYPCDRVRVDERIDTTDFAHLTQIEGLLRDIGTAYEARLRISKYIINARGDDYYTADKRAFMRAGCLASQRCARRLTLIIMGFCGSPSSR